MFNNLLLKLKTNCGQALCFVSLNKYLTICIYYNKYIIYFNTFYDHLFYYQTALQTAYSKCRIYTASLQRAHGALEDPTALPQRAV